MIFQNIIKKYGVEEVTKKQVIEYAEECGLDQATLLKIIEPHKSGRGKYNLGVNNMNDEVKSSLIPAKDDFYVETNFYQPIAKVIESRTFFPVMLTGPSGISKTLTVEQIAHKLERELVRVNITVESDEDSLMGGFRLEEGNTVFHYGPVVEAMKRGAILLLDEYDLGHPARILCLQSVMEGKGFFIKKTGEMIRPAEGFNIIATCNTKGAGDESGSFIGTQILNEAALDRFPITVEADYPDRVTEKNILKQAYTLLDMPVEKNIDILLDFAEKVRKAYSAGGDIAHNISTRRLVNIVRAHKIYGDLETAFLASISRYDQHTIKAFQQIWESIKPVNESDLKKKKEAEKDPFSAFKPF